MQREKDPRPLFLAGAILFAVLLTQTGQAHKGITSRFTYNIDVYPVFLNRCGHCHVDGGVGPMSLLKYEDAFPWAESLRTELLEAGSGDPHDFVKAAHRDLSARELDIILDWVTGGTPEGDKANAPAPVAFKNEWARGQPNLAISLPVAFQMPAGEMEVTQEFLLPVVATREISVNAIDLLPGNPSIVRQAVILLRSKDGSIRTLGTWAPRQSPVPLAVKPALRLAPGSELVARIHYKKTWKFEGQPMTDQSTIGLYFE